MPRPFLSPCRLRSGLQENKVPSHRATASLATAPSALCPGAPIPAHPAPPAHPGEPAAADGTNAEEHSKPRIQTHRQGRSTERTGQRQPRILRARRPGRAGPALQSPGKKTRTLRQAHQASPASRGAATAVLLRVHLLRCTKSPGGRHSKHKADIREAVFTESPFRGAESWAPKRSRGELGPPTG